MNSYKEFPPVDQFKLVLLSFPKSAYLFAKLWSLKPPSGHISIRMDDVKSTLGLSQTLLRNQLFNLTELHLLKFEEKGVFFVITFPVKND